MEALPPFAPLTLISFLDTHGFQQTHWETGLGQNVAPTIPSFVLDDIALTPQPNSEPGTHPKNLKPSAPVAARTQAIPTPLGARYEAHEGTSALGMSYNPPGGGPRIGGRGLTFTDSLMLDAVIKTCIGLGAVFIGGVVYLKWYKANILNKIELAFEAGYDPALELAKAHTSKQATEGSELEGDEPWTEHLRMKEQDTIDLIIQGEEPGHYFLLLGPKGSGKGTMIFDSMAAIQADGVSMCDAHPDLEVFRLRLGRAINYKFSEDSQTGLFQRKDPREGGPALDIERALNNLEKVALRCAARRGKPFVLIIHNIHFFQNDEDGRNMILQLQQKAEAWAASGILTIVFSSDDIWPFHVMRKSASRMHVLSVSDLRGSEAVHALTRMRHYAYRKSASPEEIRSIVDIVGGRLSYLNRAAKVRDMKSMAKHMLDVEKGWILSRIGLIPDCDGDAVDEQKWSSCSWLLLQEFVKMRRAQEKEREDVIASGEVNPEDLEDLPLPAISWYKCRQIMTRADLIEDLDRANIISIDINHDVRPDSMLTLQAAIEVVEEEGFEELLNNVRDRINEIELLDRGQSKDVNRGAMTRLSLVEHDDDS